MEVGLLLGRIREVHNISSQKISQGICELSVLTKFETGKRSMEKLAFEALYQRMGKYSDRFQSVLDNDEYDLMLQRWRIGDCIDEGRFDEAKVMIASYKETVKDNNLHLQYINFIECEIMHKTDVSLELRIKKLEEALAYTYPKFSEKDMRDNYYSRIEFYIIAQYARYMQLSGDKERAARIFTLIIEIIEGDIYDRSEMEMHYRHVGFWLMEYYMDKKAYEVALQIGEKTLRRIKSGGFVSLLTETLENISICKEYMGEDVSRERSHIEVLKRFMSEYEIPTKEQYFPRYIEERVYNVNDIIRQRRIMKGLTQEEILGEGCSRRTINRIENNKATTQKKTRQFLLNKLNFPENKYIAAVDTHDYTAFMLYNKIRDSIDSGEYDDIEVVLEKMQSIYKFNTINSKQFFFTVRNEISLVQNYMYESSIDDMKIMLGKTLGNIDEINLKHVMLLENEWGIIKDIVGAYKLNGDYVKCLSYLRVIDESYDEFSIHKNPNIYLAVKRKMGDILGEMSDVVRGNWYAECGLKAMKRIEFLSYIPVFGYLFAWNLLEKKPNISIQEKKVCKEMLEYAYVIASLYKNNGLLEKIKIRCEKKSIVLDVG